MCMYICLLSRYRCLYIHEMELFIKVIISNEGWGLLFFIIVVVLVIFYIETRDRAINYTLLRNYNK